MANLATHFSISSHLARAIIKDYKDGHLKLAGRLHKEQARNEKLDLIKSTIEDLIESK